VGRSKREGRHRGRWKKAKGRVSREVAGSSTLSKNIEKGSGNKRERTIKKEGGMPRRDNISLKGRNFSKNKEKTWGKKKEEEEEKD